MRSLFTEWYFLVRGMPDESWFYDSPLSAKGISQAESVAKFLRETNPKYSTPKEAKFLRLIKGEEDEMDFASGTDDKNRDYTSASANRCVLI